jgi:hypothetical protein
VPIFIVFIVIAFFDVSEMGLIEYTAKIVRSQFLDAPIKFQNNFPRIHPADIAIKKARTTEQKQTIEIKDAQIDEKIIQDINEKSLF